MDTFNLIEFRWFPKLAIGIGCLVIVIAKMSFDHRRRPAAFFELFGSVVILHFGPRDYVHRIGDVTLAKAQASLLPAAQAA